MKNKTKKRNYLSSMHQLTAKVMVVVMLFQIVAPTVAAAAQLTSDQAIAQALTNAFFQRSSVDNSFLYAKADFAAATNLQHQNIKTFHSRLLAAKISLPSPIYIPIAGDVTVIVPHYPTGKLAGDEYVQNRLIRQQIYNQIGRHMIDPEGYASEIVQINALYDNAFAYAQRTGKIYGQKITSSEADALTADIIWPEQRLINNEIIVVPVLHLTAATIAKQSVNDHKFELLGSVSDIGSLSLDAQSLVTGRNSFLSVVNNLAVTSGGKIKSEGNLAIKVGGSAHLAGSVISVDSSLNLRVGGIFSVLAGQITAKNNLDIYAEQINLKTPVHLFSDRYGKGTRIGQITSVTSGGNIQVKSGGDIQLEGSVVKSTNGSITFNAKNNINILPITTQYASQSTQGDWEVSKNSLNVIGSKISAQETIKLIAGGAINITASELISTLGGIELLAQQGIYILDDLNQVQIQKVDRKGKTTGQSSEFRTEAVRAILKAGKGVLLDSEFGDVILKATEITSAEGAQVNARNGKVHLLMTKELEEFHLQTVKKSTWTIKTRTEDVVHENNIQNAIVGGLQVQAKYGINVEYTGKEGATFEQQVDEFRNIPGMEWLADLYDKNIDTNWAAMDEIHKELRKTKRNLSPAAMAIVAICVAVATGGAGAGWTGAIQSSVAGATQGVIGASAATTLGFAMSAGAVTLTTQAAQSLAAGNSLGATLSALDSSESLKSLAISMATAGAMQHTDIDFFTTAAESKNLAVSLAGQAGQAVYNSAVSAGISVAINGGNSKDYLNAFNNSLITSAVNSIGNKLAGKISNARDLGVAGKYITHAALGCAAASVTAKVQDSDIENACASGAGGAVISQVMADALKAKLDNIIARADNGTASVLEVGQQIQDLKQNGADVGKLISGLFAFALGGDVNASADTGARVVRSNAYRYASTIQVAETLYKRAGFARGNTFAERMANVYEEEARLYMDANGVSKSMQDSLLQKARDAGVFKSVGQYDAAFTGNAKMFEDAVSKRQELTFNTSLVTPDDFNVDTFVSEPGYGDIAQPVFNFFGATDRLVNTLTPAERAGASFLISAASGGFIKTALVTGATVGVSKLLPEGMPNVPELAAKAGVGFVLNRDFKYVSEGVTLEIEDPIDLEIDGYGMNEAVNGFAYIIENVAGIRSPITGNNGKSIVQNSYDKRAQNPEYTIGSNRIHPIFKSMDDFYNAAKTGGKRILIMGNYSHYKNGEFIKHNDGKLGEQSMKDVLKGATGKDFKSIQNLSGHGPDGVYIDRSTKPATIYLAEAKSSINGANAAKAPTGSATARLDKWIADYEAGKYANAGSEALGTLQELKVLRDAGVQSPVKGIWVQVDAPQYNSSVQGINAIINVW